jgi:hypothetical protein
MRICLVSSLGRQRKKADLDGIPVEHTALDRALFICLMQRPTEPFCEDTDQCSAVQCSAVQCSAVQCSAVQCSAVQCSAVQFSSVQCSAVQCSAVQCSHPGSVHHGAVGNVTHESKADSAGRLIQSLPSWERVFQPGLFHLFSRPSERFD